MRGSEVPTQLRSAVPPALEVMARRYEESAGMGIR
jgi:hypothetical protein